MAQATDPVELTLARRQLAVRRLIYLYPVAALLLRDEASVIASAHQFEQAGIAVTERHEADADADLEHLFAPDKTESADPRQKVLGNALGRLRRTVIEEYRELVAAQTSDAVTIADDRAEHPGDVPQQFVTSRVTTGVIYDFEVIEVEVEQRVPLGVVARPRE